MDLTLETVEADLAEKEERDELEDLLIQLLIYQDIDINHLMLI